MVSLGKCNGSCNVVDELSAKIYLSSKTSTAAVDLRHLRVEVADCS